jgi:hypothetical protein
MKRSFRYVVELADEFGFDFGGEAVAGFAHKGSAFVFARDLRDDLGRSARVLDCFSRVPREVFHLAGPATEAAEAARMAF